MTPLRALLVPSPRVVHRHPALWLLAGVLVGFCVARTIRS